MAKDTVASFTAAVYKVGVNPTVSVPEEVTSQLGINGFAKVKGKIDGKEFETTLIPVEGKPHRLSINSEIRERTGIEFGDVVNIDIQVVGK